MTVGTEETEEDGSRHARYRRRRRVMLAGHVEIVEGVQVSTHPDCPHGTGEGYDLYKCRCAKCSEHSAAPRMKEHREQRYQATAQEVLRAHGVPEKALSVDATDELIRVWRASRGASRLRKVALHLGRTYPGMTPAQVFQLTEQLVEALRGAGAGTKTTKDADRA